MSSYFKKGKGWRFDFYLEGIRYTEAWFKTKKEAVRAEAKKREELKKPAPRQGTPTDTDFLTLVNKRLDSVKAYNSSSHYTHYCYTAKKWIKLWGDLTCSEITSEMVERFVLERSKVSAFTANKEIRYLRATFNFGKKKGLVSHNPVEGIAFLPVEKRLKQVPSIADIEKVILAADPDTQDYLIALSHTMARVGEINRLSWEDVNLDDKYLVLYTRKKKGGHLTPRKVPLTPRLLDILSRRYTERDPEMPWVFWHNWFDRKEGVWKRGPYQYRKRLMKCLCEKTKVPFFQFHALRHAGASILEKNKVPIGSIQRILGHENRTTTEIYLHSLENSEVEAMMTLERVLKKSHTDSHTKQKST